MKLNTAILFLLSFFLFTTCCKDKAKDPAPQPTPDPCVVNPCSCKKPVSAEFVMEEQGGYLTDPYYFETDTMVYINRLRLTAKEDNAQYKWKIGSDTTTFINKSFEIKFTDKEINQTLPVTLIVDKQPDTVCFPNDDGKDTLTKYITIKALCDAVFDGTYTGYWTSAPNDTFTITIETVVDSMDTWQPPLYECHYVRLYNLNNKECLTTNPYSDNRYSYNNLRFDILTDECGAAHGIASVDWKDKKKITIDYTMYVDSALTQERTVKFIGTRK